MTDYTDSQTQSIQAIDGVAHPNDSESCSKTAELHYRSCWGPRNRFTHIKATNMGNGQFHFSNKWLMFLAYPNNVTVFYRREKPIGWLYHKEIADLITNCPFEGKDLNSPLRTMETYNVNYAS